MKITLLKSTEQPPQGALIVCAGTVHLRKVQDMSAGFEVFKQYFSQHLHVDSSKGTTWEQDWDAHLSNFQNINHSLPVYYRIAQQDDYIGGIATVSQCTSTNIITPIPKENRSAVYGPMWQYKQAVRGAILDAIELNKPLYLQPLGIGVYRWDPESAATYFAEVITEYKDHPKLNIHIPIHDMNEHSNDLIFAQALQSKLEKTCTVINNLSTSIAPSKPSHVSFNCHLILIAGGAALLAISLVLISNLLSTLLLGCAGIACIVTGSFGLFATSGHFDSNQHSGLEFPPGSPLDLV